MRKVVSGVGLAAVVFFATTAGAECPTNTFCAGASSVDMTWHVGSGQGQYGSAGNGLSDGRYDPFHHSTKMVPSHGMQSRLFTKAVVVRGADGAMAAVAKVDVYLQQDVLTRRVADLVSGADPTITDYVVPGLDGTRILLAATHNHSAPEYASTAWGVWLFTDTIDLRMFEATARKIAQAIHEAASRLEPARMGAGVLRYDEVQQNILGPGTADDGTPGGFPRDYFDDELTVVRFERSTDGSPIAAWVNLGMHPESLDTSDFISSDFTGMVEREIERGLGRAPGGDDGPVVVWTQGAVGDVEPDRSRAHPAIEDRDYWHRDFAQAERMSRDLGEAVLTTWKYVAAPPADDPRFDADKHVPIAEDPVVAMIDRRFAGPPAHPLPTVSNCRTLRPGAPIIGLPDCERGFDFPEQYGTTIETLQDAGLPVPDNYSPPSYGAVQESLQIHLQVLRIGDVVAAAIPGEPISDLVRNLKSRADAVPGNRHDGFLRHCEDDGSTVSCDFASALYQGHDMRPVDREAWELMLAQITNPADGWEDDLASLQGESEAQDPDAIYGNFTHEEIQDLGAPGYRLPIVVGQANDYVGYIVTYREYMRGDHYRKALTAYGPHAADYVNTRLVRMAASLQGADADFEATLSPAVGPADDVLNTLKALSAGSAGEGLLAASEAALPDDGGSPDATSQPRSIERFDGATFSWIGGSNWTDNPDVVVERLTGSNPDDDASWTVAATQEGGEVVLRLAYDSPFGAAPMDWLLGDKTYEWTATWEAFETTAPGAYRFRVEGRHRSGGAAVPYSLSSERFEVSPWSGIRLRVVRLESGVLEFVAEGVETLPDLPGLETDADAVLSSTEIHYPDFWDAPGDPYLSTVFEQRGPHIYCDRCTWRAWADTGEMTKSATVDVIGDLATAELVGESGGRPLYRVENFFVGLFPVVIDPFAVQDVHGNGNGEGLVVDPLP